MYLAAFDIDGLCGCRRTVILTLATTDALVLMDGRDTVNHLDGLGGAVALAEAAADAVVLEDHGVADADGGLFLLADRLDGSRRAELAAAGAGEAAEPLVESHGGLQKAVETGGGA